MRLISARPATRNERSMKEQATQVSVDGIRELIARGPHPLCADVHKAAGDGVAAETSGDLAVGFGGTELGIGDSALAVDRVTRIAESILTDGFHADRPILTALHTVKGEYGQSVELPCILDGWHRAQAVELASLRGWTGSVPIRELTGSQGELARRVWSGINHRDLSRAARAVLAAQLAKRAGLTEEQAAEEYGVHRRDLAILRNLSLFPAGRAAIAKLGLTPRSLDRINSAGALIALADYDGAWIDLGGNGKAIAKGLDKIGLRFLYLGSIEFLQEMGFEGAKEDRKAIADTIANLKRASCRAIQKIAKGDGDLLSQKIPAMEAELENLAAELARLANPAPKEEPRPEFFGEKDPIPLTDVWPGLKHHLPPDRETRRLVRCERILVLGDVRAFRRTFINIVEEHWGEFWLPHEKKYT